MTLRNATAQHLLVQFKSQEATEQVGSGEERSNEWCQTAYEKVTSQRFKGHKRDLSWREKIQICKFVEQKLIFTGSINRRCSSSRAGGLGCIMGDGVLARTWQYNMSDVTAGSIAIVRNELSSHFKWLFIEVEHSPGSAVVPSNVRKA